LLLDSHNQKDPELIDS